MKMTHTLHTEREKNLTLPPQVWRGESHIHGEELKKLKKNKEQQQFILSNWGG